MKLHITQNAGPKRRTIYLDREGLIHIGCFVGTQEEAEAAIRNKYRLYPEEAEAYIAKVRECFEGVEYPDEHLPMGMDAYFRICLAKLGLFVDQLVRDPAAAVRDTLVKGGHGLDVLVNDPILHIRYDAIVALKR